MPGIGACNQAVSAASGAGRIAARRAVRSDQTAKLGKMHAMLDMPGKRKDIKMWERSNGRGGSEGVQSTIWG